MGIARLSHLELRTPDVDRLAAHYVDVLDFVEVGRASDRTIYLTTQALGHDLALVPGDPPGLAAISFEVSGSLDELAGRLEGAGFATERRTDPNPTQSSVVRIQDPEGNPLMFAEPAARNGAVHVESAVRPQKLGHVCYFVQDVQGTVEFYEQRLGFRWSDWMGDFFVFLRCGPEHHVVNLLRSEANRRLHHLAYEARDFAHIQLLCDRLAQREVPLVWGPGRHGPGHNVFTYHRDPDGNVVELFCDLDVMLDEGLGYFDPRPWHKDRPQRPKVWEPGPLVPNSWGPMPPPDFLA